MGDTFLIGFFTYRPTVQTVKAVGTMDGTMKQAVRYVLLDLSIDLDTRQVQRADCTLEVTGLSFDLLACLLVRGNAVVPFDELMAAVWAPAVVNEETVTQRVKLLRQALGDNGRK